MAKFDYNDLEQAKEVGQVVAGNKIHGTFIKTNGVFVCLTDVRRDIPIFKLKIKELQQKIKWCNQVLKSFEKTKKEWCEEHGVCMLEDTLND